MELKNNLREQGITLVALIVTIILLLILAGIALNLGIGSKGIISRAQDSRQQAELADEKEKIQLIKSNLDIDKIGENQEVNTDAFQKIVDGVFGNSKATGTIEEQTYIVTVNKNGHVYTIDENGNTTFAGNKDDFPVDKNPGILDGDGTEENPYKIMSIEDLVAFSYNVNDGSKYGTNQGFKGKCFALGRSLYFNGLFNSYANPDSKYERASGVNGYIPSETATTTIKELMTTGDGFISIGNGPNFGGNFDGKGHFLANIKTSGNGAFISNKDTGGYIKNFGIESGNYGGIISRYTNNSEELLIENCYNKANVSGNGGLIGSNYSEKRNNNNK